VLSRDDEETYKSFRNLPDVQVILVGELNAYDILCNDWIVFTPATLPGYVEGEGDSPVTIGATRTAAPIETDTEDEQLAEAAEAEAEQLAEATAVEAEHEEAIDAEDEQLAEAAGEAVLTEVHGEAVLTDATDPVLISAAAEADDEAAIEAPAAADAEDETVALSPSSDTDDAEEAQ
jgi:hypothetical protein